MQSAIHIKSDKNNFTRIQCADKDDTQYDCCSLLATATKSGVQLTKFQTFMPGNLH